jgi:hypothetical protein
VITVLLFIVAFGVPWAIHLSQPRQRPLILVIGIGILLILGIFFANPLGSLIFWIGLVLGVASIVFMQRRGRFGGLSSIAKLPRRAPRRTSRRDDVDDAPEPHGYADLGSYDDDETIHQG